MVEKEQQRLRRVGAHRELWQLELREGCDLPAVQHMHRYLQLMVGHEERLAALADLHEALAAAEERSTVPRSALEVALPCLAAAVAAALAAHGQ